MCKRILAVDDDAEATSRLQRLLEARGFSVAVENDSTKVLAKARKFRPDVVILDYLMPQAHGGDVAWQIASDPALRQTRMIMYSGVPVEEFTRTLPPVEIAVVEKPVDADVLIRLIDAKPS
jgi:CheY-like chemotaxis protein